ncbi:PREDICTED: uncharacterized protein LOC109155147 [Ipomoea nil]|uniref:uncharacterized protein LOC109155147 n=1 Tax=Ipomoea nil TaxID=35883 RepID=UPI000901AD0F|nr:PREDICTED: uncharacterized protein LOC109155147 [Ipomoea nil]
MEAKFIALDLASQEAEWLRNLLADVTLWGCPAPAVPMHCGSQTAICVAQNSVYNGKRRHIRVKHESVRQLILNGVITMEFVRSERNIADPFTKGLKRKAILDTSREMDLKPNEGKNFLRDTGTGIRSHSGTRLRAQTEGSERIEEEKNELCVFNEQGKCPYILTQASLLSHPNPKTVLDHSDRIMGLAPDPDHQQLNAHQPRSYEDLMRTANRYAEAEDVDRKKRDEEDGSERNVKKSHFLKNVQMDSKSHIPLNSTIPLSDVTNLQYADLGDPEYSCEHCNAIFWNADGKSNIRVDVVADIKEVLDKHNVLVKSFWMAKGEIESNPRVEVKMRLIGKRSTDARTYNLPNVSEVAALIVGDLDPTLGERDILVESKCGDLKRISELNPSYLPLQYPILFPYGEDGYREDIQFSVPSSSSNVGQKRISQREFFAFRIHERLNEVNTLLFSKRLLQQFLVDAYTMVESSRLTFIRQNQKSLRCEAYKGLSDALTRGEVDPTTQGKRIVLPSSFTGGARYMIPNYQDAMAICRWNGYPNLFITFTCNPKWPEIRRYIHKRGLKAEDRPDIVCRIFKLKLDSLIREIRVGQVFGEVSSVIYTIEFQKRGLPHAHILLFLSRQSAMLSTTCMDNIISAEIPDKDGDIQYYNAVEEFMIHGPCGVVNKKSPCMINGKCSKHFPKKFVEAYTLDDNGYPKYRRRDDGRTVLKSGTQLDNRYVVPHNKYLLLKYNAHINVEWCNQSRSIKYLFKYVNKGNDRVTDEFYKSTVDENSAEVIDEIRMYYDCRYVSACEATWRLFSNDVQFRMPSVERLSFHLPDCQSVIFDDDDSIEHVLSRPTVAQSMFTAWFEANKKYPAARLLTYIDMPTKFVWKNTVREWHPRKRRFSIGRIFYVPPGSGEIYYLRCLLNIVRGPTSFEDIKTFNGVTHLTFKDACYARGLLDDDKEYIDAINEASQWSSGHAMRKLFVILLTSNSMVRPEFVWNATWQYLSEDAEYYHRRIAKYQYLILSEESKKNFGLMEIEKLLQVYNKSLKDFAPMPLPNLADVSLLSNRLLLEELSYDREAMAKESEMLTSQLTDEQRVAYDTILGDVQCSNGGLFFVYGYGGTGKTFLWKALSSKLRSKGDIVINVASSGIASLLLPGGRTAHSRFSIPIIVNEDSTCNIKQGSHLAELVIKTNLIIWDEAPMMHKHCFEALDRTIRDLLRFNNPLSADKTFGGKTVVFGGDFRQILPVIPKGTRQDIVAATINSSYLWNNCKVLRLTKNLRLNRIEHDVHQSEVEEFANWIASIGDGTIGGPNDGYAEVVIPNDLLLPCIGDPIQTIVDSIFPDFMNARCDPNYMQSRAILAPTLEVVNSINEYMSDLHTAESKTYFSCDTVCKADSDNGILRDVHTPEFLNGLRCSGIPNHALTLKVGSPVMLLRNIDHSLGLCNGTRLVITRLSEHVIEAKIMTGDNAGSSVLVPRMSMTPSETRLPFKFQRKQFPLMLSYAMTINKSQGQRLSHVGLLLKKPVFVHGQLYVAASRVSNPMGLKILICNDLNNSCTSTTNVVYHGVFNNL